jgi:hypothetical protein
MHPYMPTSTKKQLHDEEEKQSEKGTNSLKNYYQQIFLGIILSNKTSNMYLNYDIINFDYTF